jgi:Glu-tRNA(Gln) amidotransferase subunit E-like FAD-binding protein
MANTDLSIAELIESLEAQATEHERQEAYHAEQETLHRELRSNHAAEFEEVRRHLEALRAAVGALDQAASRPSPAARAGVDDEDLGSASRPRVARMVEKVVESKRPGERFGSESLTGEVNQRFGERLRKPIDERQVSTVLRRLAEKKRIELVRRGRPHQESLYALSPTPRTA